MATRVITYKTIIGPTAKQITNHKMTKSCPGDRPLSELRVTQLRQAIKSDEFSGCTLATAICLENGEVYRVNGKHSSHAMEGQNTKNIPITLAHYECDTLQDVAELYSTFDSRVSVRTQHDINSTYAASDEILRPIPSRTIDLAGNGIAYAKWGTAAATQHSAAERAGLLIKNKHFVQWVHNMLTKTRRDESLHVKKSSVNSVMWQTYRLSVEMATEFWAHVILRDGPDSKSGDRQLSHALWKIGRGGPRGRKPMEARDIVIICSKAWNAFCKGERIELLRSSVNENVPTLITPLKKAQ